ncbi:uncharacterized protein J8A68_002901 [[Candida] subhashii]|uniref:alcohol dehydrogenase n=1 Tax=[Candida] subhashii TaxID=561895 RepID=A0A8J5QQT4_9ASCO|nr:uncharacterized protein J8A68_002901 [[Candida] subhashii]KAG7663652.1 hypothetical protein J8A68_002901 [[Candida] subhashii]
MNIPETQKAVVFETHGGPLLYKDVPVPEPGPNDLLLRMKYSGVCHSDLHAWKGDWTLPTKLPLIGGHEGVGEVVAMGDNVEGWNIGDHAGIKWLYSTCLTCEYCESTDEQCCGKQVISGYTHDGTFQQYATADAIQAARIPQGVDLASVAPILCAGVTAYKALKTAERKAGEWVCVSGAGGGLGSLAIQYAKAMGFRVVGIDCGQEKGAFVKSLGAEVYVDFMKEKDVITAVRNATGGGAHAVINVSVSEKAMQQSISLVRPKGSVVLVGLPPGAIIPVSVFQAVAGSITIRGSAVGNRKDTREAIDMFSRGLIQCPIKVAGLTELPEIFSLMEEGKIMGRYVVDLAR